MRFEWILSAVLAVEQIAPKMRFEWILSAQTEQIEISFDDGPHTTRTHG